MTKFLLGAALGLAVLTTPAFAAERCSAAVLPQDVSSLTKGMTVEAMADGPSCGKPAAMIVFRLADGTIAWQEAYAGEFVMFLAGKTSKAELEAGLKEWADPLQAGTTEALPEWKDGAQMPGEGDEFPFYQEEGMDRETYEGVRKGKQPMFCYVQGMESTACIVFDKENGGAFKVGAQSFPG